MTKDYPWGKGTPKWTRDATANDSDKTILTVPTGKYVVLNHLYATLATTATVGNRLVKLVVTDGTNDVCVVTAANVQAASLTWAYNWLKGGVGEASSLTELQCLPELILLAGYTVRVYDSAAIDAAADDLTVVLHYVEYDA